MEGQYGVPWRDMKVHIIARYIYHLIGEVKWSKTWAYD